MFWTFQRIPAAIYLFFGQPTFFLRPSSTILYPASELALTGFGLLYVASSLSPLRWYLGINTTVVPPYRLEK